MDEDVKNWSLNLMSRLMLRLETLAKKKKDYRERAFRQEQFTKEQGLWGVNNDIDQLQVFLGGLEQTGSQCEGDFFKYIAADSRRFCDTLHKIVNGLREKSEFRFLEVGCGIGSKMRLVQMAFEDARIPVKVSGIERDEKYLKIAKRVLPGKPEFHHCDALEFDRYGEFDIIYFYVPFANHTLQMALEQKILDEAKTGSLVWTHTCFWIQGLDLRDRFENFDNLESVLRKKVI